MDEKKKFIAHVYQASMSLKMMPENLFKLCKIEYFQIVQDALFVEAFFGLRPYTTFLAEDFNNIQDARKNMDTLHRMVLKNEKIHSDPTFHIKNTDIEKQIEKICFKMQNIGAMRFIPRLWTYQFLGK